MDDIVNGQLLGTVNGNLSGGVGLVTGKRNLALYTNGLDQMVDLGSQIDSCLGYFVRCTKGLVMTMWLQLGNGTGVILASGGVTRRGVMVKKDAENVTVYFRGEGRENWKLSVARDDLRGWSHISIIWNMQFGGRLYANGRLVDTEPTASIIRNKDVIIDDKNHLVLGASNVYKDHGEMILDELYVWDAIMHDEEIWAAYIAEILRWLWWLWTECFHQIWFENFQAALNEIPEILQTFKRIFCTITISNLDWMRLKFARRAQINKYWFGLWPKFVCCRGYGNLSKRSSAILWC